MKTLQKNIRIALSAWYPQLEIDANIQHFLQIPPTIYPNLINPPSYTPYISLVSTPTNMSTGIFSATQTLYSNNLFFAARTSRELRNQASKILKFKDQYICRCNKAFFDVLLTEEEINVLNEDIVRLQHNYKDAYSFIKMDLRIK